MNKPRTLTQELILQGKPINGVCTDYGITPTSPTTTAVMHSALTSAMTSVLTTPKLNGLTVTSFSSLTAAALEANLATAKFGSAKLTASTVPIKVVAIYIDAYSHAGSTLENPWFLILESPTAVKYFACVLGITGGGDANHLVNQMYVTFSGDGITLPVGWSMSVGCSDIVGQISLTNNTVKYMTAPASGLTPFIASMFLAATELITDWKHSFTTMTSLSHATKFTVIDRVMTAGDSAYPNKPIFNVGKLFWRVNGAALLVNDFTQTKGLVETPLFTPSCTDTTIGVYAHQDLHSAPVIKPPNIPTNVYYSVMGTLRSLLFFGYYL